jgi:hypothetical protein
MKPGIIIGMLLLSAMAIGIASFSDNAKKQPCQCNEKIEHILLANPSDPITPKQLTDVLKSIHDCSHK